MDPTEEHFTAASAGAGEQPSASQSHGAASCETRTGASKEEDRENTHHTRYANACINMFVDKALAIGQAYGGCCNRDL